MVAGVMFSMCGYTDHNPVMGDPVTPGLRMGVVFCAYGMKKKKKNLNLIAMKFYPLTKEKMAEIQDEVAQIKMKTMAENA